MNTENLEFLLGQLIERQDKIIERLEAIEAVVESSLNNSEEKLSSIEVALGDVNNVLSQIEDSFNCWADRPTFAKTLMDELNCWSESPTFAKTILDSIDRVNESVNDLESTISLK